MSDATTSELVTRLQQEDLKFLLLSDDMFSDVSVITEDDGDVEAQMNKALSTVTSRDGKRGACVIVQQPTGENQGSPKSFPIKLNWTLLVLEWRAMNKDTANGGTGKAALAIALRCAYIVKTHRAGGLTMTFNAGDPFIEPVGAETVDLMGMRVPLVAYEVRFWGNTAETLRPTYVANPTISAPSISLDTGTPVGAAGDTVTLACATAGSEIWYTTDLTHPCSQNSVAEGGTAELYSAPFTVPSCTLRVRAHKSGSFGSDTMAALFQ